MPLFEHILHPHVPQNPNDAHKAEQASFNQRVAVTITRATNTKIYHDIEQIAAYLTAQDEVLAKIIGKHDD